MAELAISGSSLGSQLETLLMADDINVGSEPSYQLCKTIYTYHPLGKKMVDAPLTVAMAKNRKISVPASPEDVVTEAFEREWNLLKCNRYIENHGRLSRIYGISALVMTTDSNKPGTEEPIALDEPILPEWMDKINLVFQVFDPLNTAGSMVLDQNPLSVNFQRPISVSISGKAVHPSRCIILMNEDPIYIQFTASAFGFVGRSVYQRALFPLKSFVQSMKTDDMVQRKAGILVAKMKQAGSLVDNLMARAYEQKRIMLKDAKTDNVISVGIEESIESPNLQNLDGAVSATRQNIIANIANAADMPAKLLTQESFAEGFGEGVEDAKAVANYIESVRHDLEDDYEFFTKVVQRRAWSPAFYRSVQQAYPEEYSGIDYETAFYRWKNSFTAEWPDLIDDREKNNIETEKNRLAGIQGVVEKLAPHLDPENKAALLEWAADNLNELRISFPNKLTFDTDSLRMWNPQPVQTGFGETDGVI